MDSKTNQVEGKFKTQFQELIEPVGSPAQKTQCCFGIFTNESKYPETPCNSGLSSESAPINQLFIEERQPERNKGG